MPLKAYDGACVSDYFSLKTRRWKSSALFMNYFAIGLFRFHQLL